MWEWGMVLETLNDVRKKVKTDDRIGCQKKVYKGLNYVEGMVL